jgi:hypothetical protein
MKSGQKSVFIGHETHATPWLDITLLHICV